MYDEVKKLRNEVQLLSDELAIMKRKYEDIIYNLDTDNFSSRFVKEQGDMRTAVEVTAEGIKTKVSKEDLDKELEQYTSISQTYEAIESVASKSVDLSNATKKYFDPDDNIDPENDFTNENRIYAATVTDDGTRNGKVLSVTYYYYNDTVKKWQTLSGNTIYTICKQTNEGFEFLGNVVISGDLITGGTITGSNISGGSFSNSADTVYLSLGGSISSDMGDMTLSTDDGRQVFQVYDEGLSTLFKTAEKTFLAVSGSSVYPYGTWNFKYADVTDLDGGSGGVAVFG